MLETGEHGACTVGSRITDLWLVYGKERKTISSLASGSSSQEIELILSCKICQSLVAKAGAGLCR